MTGAPLRPAACGGRPRTLRPRPRAPGFSLIEVLVVLALLGMLLGFTAFAVSRYRETGRITEARTRVLSLQMLLESYHDRTGGYPPARLAALGVSEHNGVNEGIESLVLAFGARAYGGRRLDERWLGNRDGDEARDGLDQHHGGNALLEVLDPWDNPLVYLPAGEYEHAFRYRLESAFGVEDSDASAAHNPLTGSPFHLQSFQLLSAGPDGLLGTEDDVANYETPSPER